MMSKGQLGVIGVGKMGEAMVKGLLASKQLAPERIIVTDKDASRLTFMRESYGVATHPTCADVVSNAGTCILAVKPQDMAGVLEEIKGAVAESCLIISIAAGITVPWLQGYLGRSAKIVRAMPNAAAMVGMAATGLFLSEAVSPEEGKAAKAIFDAVGTTVFVQKEEHLNIVTGLSGSGPAYLFVILEAMTEAGVYCGLAREVAAGLALQTLKGSAQMALESGKPIPLLKETITSPGGTTMAGLKVLEEGKVRATILNAVAAATERSRELAQ